MARILILSFSPIARDPRVMRQVRALSSKHEVTVAGYGKAPRTDVEFVEVQAPQRDLFDKALSAFWLFLGKFDYEYWRSTMVGDALSKLEHREFDLVIANDVVTLPIALRLAVGAPVVFDGHEYSPREFEDSLLWRIFLQGYMHWLCASFLPQVHSAMTVCTGIADEYRREFCATCQVVHNCPDAEALSVHPVSRDCIRLVHHGIAKRARHLEGMIELMRLLGTRFTLDLFLVDADRAYLSELKVKAANDARIRFRDPVQMELISKTLNAYDMGLFLLPPVNFNYKYALPNKFFEFIQARLAVAIGPSPEMKHLTEAWGFGVVAEDFQPKSLAAALNALSSEQIYAMKHCAAAAAQQLHGGVVAGQLVSIVDRALMTKPGMP